MGMLPNTSHFRSVLIQYLFSDIDASTVAEIFGCSIRTEYSEREKERSNELFIRVLSGL